MSDLCEQYCPAYETCIRAFDVGTAARNSLLEQRKSLNDISGFIDAVGEPDDYVDMTDDDIERLKAQHRVQLTAAQDIIDHRIALSETKLAGVARSLMESATAQATCPGPKLNLLGKLALGIAAIRRRRLPNEADRQHKLDYFAKCASAAAKSTLTELPDTYKWVD